MYPSSERSMGGMNIIFFGVSSISSKWFHMDGLIDPP